MQNPVVVEHHHFVYRPVEVVITPTSPFLGGLNLLCRRGAFKFLVEIESTQVFPSLGEPISEEKPNLLTSLLFRLGPCSLMLADFLSPMLELMTVIIYEAQPLPLKVEGFRNLFSTLGCWMKLKYEQSLLVELMHSRNIYIYSMPRSFGDVWSNYRNTDIVSSAHFFCIGSDADSSFPYLHFS